MRSKCHLSIVIMTLATILICQTSEMSASDSVASNNCNQVENELYRDLINISIDPRIELLSAIQLLSNYHARWNLMTHYDLTYKNEVEEYFSHMNGHPVIAIFDSMSVKKFTFDAPPAFMLHLSYPELKIQHKLPPRLLKKTEYYRIEFLIHLRNFAERSDFQTFFDKHIPAYNKMAERCEQFLTGIPIVDTLENYFGMQQKSYNIILVPLMVNGGFGPRVNSTSGYDIYHLLGPSEESDGFPIFQDKKDFEYRCWHEFSHSFVNPITDQFNDKVQSLSQLYIPISKDMKRWGYHSWKSTLSEHIVKAVENRLHTIKFGEIAGEEALKKNRERGFRYIDVICNKLETYEQNRDKYPTLLDFYPELLSALTNFQ